MVIKLYKLEKDIENRLYLFKAGLWQAGFFMMCQRELFSAKTNGK